METLFSLAERTADFFVTLWTSPLTLVALGLFAAFLVIEALVTGWKRSSAAQLVAFGPSARTDIAWFALGQSGVTVLLIMPVSMGIAYVTATDGTFQFQPAAALGLESRALDYVVYLVWLDLISWTLHWIMHKVPFLWAFHKVHHSATAMTGMTTGRVHLVEVALIALWRGWFAGLLGLAPDIVMALWTLQVLQSFVSHSNLDWDYGWVGRWLIVSPHAHRVHHSQVQAHWDSNYAMYFIFWDRIFGTYREAPSEEVRLGLADERYNRGSFLREFLVPFQEAFRPERRSAAAERDSPFE